MAIFIAIIISSVALAIENPLLDPESTVMKVLFMLDKVMTFVFLTELILKVITNGLLLNGKDSYLRNGWNVLDFIIVFFSIVSLFFSDVNLGIFKILRLLRVLRPIRVISKNEGLKVSVMALISSIPPLGNVAIICFLAFIIFGTVAVTFFKGTFYYCDFGSIDIDV